MTGALQAIIFDFDGVITDSERVHLRAYQEVLATLGLTLSDEAYYTNYLGYDDEQSLRSYARKNGLEWTDQQLKELIEAKVDRYAELAASDGLLFPGAAAFIRQAADAVPLAIASGALTEEIEEALERTGLQGLFSVIVGADQTARSKPAPDPYLEAFARLLANSPHGIERGQTVAIEDSRWGLVSAGQAGLRLVAVTNTYRAEEIEQFAELVVSGLDQLTMAALDALCASPPRPLGPASRNGMS